MAYRDVILASGPVGYWRLGEASGTNANDETANNNDGTYVNTPTLAATGLVGDADTAVTFNGTDEYVTLVDSSLYSPLGAEFTIEAWVKPSTVDSTTRVFFGNWGTSAVAVVYLNLTTGNKFGSFWRDTDSDNVSLVGTTTVVAGTTYHVVVVRTTSSNVKLYVNGVEEDSETNALLTNISLHGQHVPSIGALYAGSPTSPFAGTVDEVAMYATVLSGATILAHYEAGVPTAQFARPDGTTTAGAWTAVGAATLHEALDETTPSDSDYAEGPVATATPAAFKVTTSNITDPAVSTGHKVRYRIGKNSSGGDAVQVTVRLKQGGTTIASWVRTVPDAATTYEETLTGGEADAITDYTLLDLEFEEVKI